MKNEIELATQAFALLAGAYFVPADEHLTTSLD